MGVAKAALEASVRYLATDLGQRGVRVNAISSGPIKTLAAMGISGFKDILDVVETKAPLKRNVTQEDVAKTALYLSSDLASGVTGEIIYVDSGFNIMGF
jgi:enoyl-[acyl-carrier protein] reductase I